MTPALVPGAALPLFAWITTHRAGLCPRFDQMHFIIGCYERFGIFLAHLCSFTMNKHRWARLHEAPIHATNAPSHRPANGRSCRWRSRPPDLCWDWLTEQGEDQKTEGEGSLQYIPNIPNTANSLRALSHSHWGVLQRAWGQGSRLED